MLDNIQVIEQLKLENPYRTEEGYAQMLDSMDADKFLQGKEIVDLGYEPDYMEFMEHCFKKLEQNIPLNQQEITRFEWYFRDKMWRITSGVLYKVRNKDGVIFPFKPTKEQYDLLKNYQQGKNVILKARQLGFTTLIAIIFLDDALFIKNQSIGMLAQTHELVTDLLNIKIKRVYEDLPAFYKQIVRLEANNATTVEFSNWSKIKAAVEFRWGTLTHLHVSELGKIAARDPKRTEEIFTGAVPAVNRGLLFIESTAEGGHGKFYEIVQQAREIQKEGKKLNDMQYKFFFYPWWENTEYQLDDPDMTLTENTLLYFEKLELKYGIEVTKNQMKWWQATRDILDFKIKQEYPSHPDEAFEANLEGAYFQEELSLVEAEGRVRPIKYRKDLPLYLTMDLGINDPTSMLFFQIPHIDIDKGVGQVNILEWVHTIDYDLENVIEWVVRKRERERWWAKPIWFLPHDAKKSSQINSLKSSSYVKSQGYKTYVLKKAQSKYDLIGLGKKIFRFCFFNSEGIMSTISNGNQVNLLSILGEYREKISRVTGLGMWIPVQEGDAIHVGDAWTYLGQACIYLSRNPEGNIETVYNHVGYSGNIDTHIPEVDLSDMFNSPTPEPDFIYNYAHNG